MLFQICGDQELAKRIHGRETEQQSPMEGMSTEQGAQGIRGQWPLSRLKKKENSPKTEQLRFVSIKLKLCLN